MHPGADIVIYGYYRYSKDQKSLEIFATVYLLQEKREKSLDPIIAGLDSNLLFQSTELAADLLVKEITKIATGREPEESEDSNDSPEKIVIEKANIKFVDVREDYSHYFSVIGQFISFDQKYEGVLYNSGLNVQSEVVGFGLGYSQSQRNAFFLPENMETLLELKILFGLSETNVQLVNWEVDGIGFSLETMGDANHWTFDVNANLGYRFGPVLPYLGTGFNVYTLSLPETNEGISVFINQYSVPLISGIAYTVDKIMLNFQLVYHYVSTGVASVDFNLDDENINDNITVETPVLKQGRPLEFQFSASYKFQ